MMEGLVPGLSLALVGLGAPGDLGARFAWARRAGYRAVQLNGAEAGVRARELGRSARRDIAASARRAEVEISGVDLWIPAEHFVDPARSDRAVGAVREALEYSVEIASLVSGGAGGAGGVGGGERGVVSVMLPATPEDDDELRGKIDRVAREIGDCAERLGAVVADHQWPSDARSTGDPIGVGIDPAAVIAEGVTSAAKAASRMGDRLAAGRLTDLSGAGMRVEPGGGEGRLDVMTYLVALATAGYQGWVAVDLRGVADAKGAAARCAKLGEVGGLGGVGGPR